MKTNPLIYFLLSLLIFASVYSQQIEVRNDLSQYFEKYDIDGCFVLYDLKNKKYIRFNPDRCAERFIPASTFKIFNSLVSLDAGVIKDEKEIIKWDGEKRFYEKWNQDLNLSDAFKYSAVWFYQELARRIGEKQMKIFIDLNNYGNKNIAGGIDRFWLDGALRISPDEQIEFLKRLYKNELKFSQRSMDIVKQIMIYDKTEKYLIRAKTGWAKRDDDQIGWFVGYLERNNQIYFFATNLQTKNPEEGFTSRIKITYDILTYLNLI